MITSKQHRSHDFLIYHPQEGQSKITPPLSISNYHKTREISLRVDRHLDLNKFQKQPRLKNWLNRYQGKHEPFLICLILSVVKHASSFKGLQSTISTNISVFTVGVYYMISNWKDCSQAGRQRDRTIIPMRNLLFYNPGTQLTNISFLFYSRQPWKTQGALLRQSLICRFIIHNHTGLL